MFLELFHTCTNKIPIPQHPNFVVPSHLNPNSIPAYFYRSAVLAIQNHIFTWHIISILV